MKLLNKLFGRNNNSKGNHPQQSVIIHFQHGLESLELVHELESRLEQTLSGKEIGYCDGHELAIDLSDGFLFLYGPNAEDLFKGIKETLESTDFLHGAIATLRFGPPEDGVKEIEVKIG